MPENQDDINADIDWDTIIAFIRRKEFTPIISNQIIYDTLFGEFEVSQDWANTKRVNYPLADGHNLTRVAQYLSVTRKNPAAAKSSYLSFLNFRLLKHISDQSKGTEGFIKKVMEESRDLTFSQLTTDRLKLPDFEAKPENPLSVLATLDIPVFLTTCHHHFIEAALRAYTKKPRTMVYCWRGNLVKKIPEEYRTDLSFMPTVETPLVFHLHGIDDYPDSLVLTEDDHLEFLAKVTTDWNDTNIIPNRVRDTLSDSLLLLLGYKLHNWDLRVLLQGLIKGRPRRFYSFAIQLPAKDKGIKDTQEFRKYLDEYFNQAKFTVYWGSVKSFTDTLWQKTEALGSSADEPDDTTEWGEWGE